MMFATVLLRIILTIVVMGSSFDRWSQIYTVPVLFLLAVMPRLRNSRTLMHAVFVCATIYYIAIDIALVQIARGLNPFLDPLDLHNHPESLIAVTLEIVTIAPVMVLIMATVGACLRLSVAVSGFLSLGAIVVVGFVIKTAANNDSVVTIILFLCGLFSVTIYVVLTREEFRLQVLRDQVTNLEQARQDASQHIRELEQARQQRHMIVSYLFHEVRNPINNVMLALSLVQHLLTKLHSSPISPFTSPSSSATPRTVNTYFNSDSLDALRRVLNEIEELTETLQTSATAACNVLNDALTAQKLDAGTFEFARNKISLNEFYGQIGRTCAHKMASTGVRTEFWMDPRLQGLTVLGDDNRLRQVIENFLSNAYKFTPQDGVIRLNVQQIGRRRVANASVCEKITIRTSVKDSGIGISPGDIDKVFKLWSQIRAGATQQGKGSGLGLAICKDFVEKGHGGKVGVISGEGKGSEFFFEIEFDVVFAEALARDLTHMEEIGPSKSVALTDSSRTNLSPMSLPQPRTTTPAEPVRGISRSQPLPKLVLIESDLESKPIELLVVEDSEVTRRLMARTLDTLRVGFHIVTNGQEAVQYATKNGPYKLILMDKEMPVMDGYKATKQLRDQGYTNPIVGVTGNGMDEQVKEFVGMGANEVLVKPIKSSTLCELLSRYGVGHGFV